MKKLAVRASANLINWLNLAQYLSPHLDIRALTDGSRSTKIDRGTYLPLPVSVKKVSKEPAPSATFESGSRRPSALSPCSRRYLESFVYQSVLM
jgi:hypothetical protein